MNNGVSMSLTGSVTEPVTYAQIVGKDKHNI